MNSSSPVLRITDRLRGKYTLAVNDGAGPLNGSDTFTRQFETPPIQHEAAAIIEEMLAALKAAQHTLITADNYRVTDLTVETFDAHLANGVPRDRLEFTTDYSADLALIDAAIAKATAPEPKIAPVIPEREAWTQDDQDRADEEWFFDSDGRP